MMSTRSAVISLIVCVIAVGCVAEESGKSATGRGAFDAVKKIIDEILADEFIGMKAAKIAYEEAVPIKAAAEAESAITTKLPRRGPKSDRKRASVAKMALATATANYQNTKEEYEFTKENVEKFQEIAAKIAEIEAAGAKRDSFEELQVEQSAEIATLLDSFLAQIKKEEAEQLAMVKEAEKDLQTAKDTLAAKEAALAEARKQRDARLAEKVEAKAALDAAIAAVAEERAIAKVEKVTLSKMEEMIKNMRNIGEEVAQSDKKEVAKTDIQLPADAKLLQYSSDDLNEMLLSASRDYEKLGAIEMLIEDVYAKMQSNEDALVAKQKTAQAAFDATIKPYEDALEAAATALEEKNEAVSALEDAEWWLSEVKAAYAFETAIREQETKLVGELKTIVASAGEDGFFVGDWA